MYIKLCFVDQIKETPGLNVIGLTKLFEKCLVKNSPTHQILLVFLVNLFLEYFYLLLLFEYSPSYLAKNIQYAVGAIQTWVEYVIVMDLNIFLCGIGLAWCNWAKEEGQKAGFACFESMS